MLLLMNLPGGFTPDAIYVNNAAEGFEIPDAILTQDKGEVYAVFEESGMDDTLQTLMENGFNEDTQVIDTEGNIILGLYAAKEATGGFHGIFCVDGSRLGDSFVFGRIAGNTMANSIKKARKGGIFLIPP